MIVGLLLWNVDMMYQSVCINIAVVMSNNGNYIMVLLKVSSSSTNACRG